MLQTCPNCGNKAIDDQSIFCNKCGDRFPENPPDKKIAVIQKVNRKSDSPTYSPVIAQRPARNTGTKTKSKGIEFGKFISFDKFITKDVISIIYILGAIGITLISLGGIVSIFLTPTSPTSSVNNTFFSPISPVDNSLFSPILWIGVLVFGNLFWRISCEIFVVVFKINDTLISIKYPVISEDDSVDYTECPHCSNIVRKDQLRECEDCGVAGCEKCIKTMGLLKKTMTCKDCFENK
jgi:hypothetical protein